MEEQIKDFIRAVAQGQSSEASDHINTIMSQKATVALQGLRTDMASTMFNAPDKQE